MCPWLIRKPIGTLPGQDWVSLILASWNAVSFSPGKTPVHLSKFSSDITSEKYPKVRETKTDRQSLRETECKIEVFRKREEGGEEGKGTRRA